jgi:hypothetical protein
MEILSIHNNEITTKLENISSTPAASLVEILKIIKKDASTSCFDLVDDRNPYNQVLVESICRYPGTGVPLTNSKKAQ